MSDSGHSHHYVLNRMKFVVWLTVAILILEVVGGILTHSLALLSDAGHILADVLALGLSWVALVLSSRPAGARVRTSPGRAQGPRGFRGHKWAHLAQAWTNNDLTR